MGFFKPNIEKMKSKRDVKGLIKVLKDKEFVVREKAAKALGEIGEQAVEPLIQALKDIKGHGTNSAVDALAKIGKPAIEPLIETLKDEDRGARGYAAEALGKIDDTRAVEPLIKALKDEEWVVRKEAVEALGKIGDARAVEPLIEALKHDHDDVRSRAARALGEIGDARAVEPLIKTKDARSWFTRHETVWALGKIGDARALDVLIEALKDENYSIQLAAREALERFKAKGALGEIAKPAVEPLIMKDAKWFSVKDEEARLPVLQALTFQKLTGGKLINAEITENNLASVKAWFTASASPGVMLPDFARACGISLINGVDLYNAGNVENLKEAFINESKVVILDENTREILKGDQRLSEAISQVNYRMLHHGNIWSPLSGVEAR
jgi:hypothetical protein